jgi:hypothetical protein
MTAFACAVRPCGAPTGGVERNRRPRKNPPAPSHRWPPTPRRRRRDRRSVRGLSLRCSGMRVLLVEIGPEGWTPTQQPPELTPNLRPFLRGSYFYFYLGEERKRRNLRRRNKENTQPTEDRRTGEGLRCSLLITRSPFHYKGFTIYRRPLGIVICPNYTFSVPDNPL